jgi:hypothetical protein
MLCAPASITGLGSNRDDTCTKQAIQLLSGVLMIVNRRANLTRDRRPILTRGGARLSEADQRGFNALPLAALLS